MRDLNVACLLTSPAKTSESSPFDVYSVRSRVVKTAPVAISLRTCSQFRDPRERPVEVMKRSGNFRKPSVTFTGWYTPGQVPIRRVGELGRARVPHLGRRPSSRARAPPLSVARGSASVGVLRHPTRAMAVNGPVQVLRHSLFAATCSTYPQA